MVNVIRLTIVVVLAGLLAACGARSAGDGGTVDQPEANIDVVVPAVTAEPVTIVAMGDSLTEGFGLDDPTDAYPAQLERRLLADGYNVEVINAGNSGETSSGARTRVDWLLKLQPDIVILATGGNDGLRGIDPAVTQENLAEITARLQSEDVTVVLAGMEMVQNMGEAYTTAFRAAYPAVSEEYQTILVPFMLEGVAADPALNQPDFIHPTAAGYAIVVETIYPYVVEALGPMQ
jgi:acyl-CoA thioesterase-1